MQEITNHMQELTNHTFDEITVGISTSVTHTLYNTEIEALALGGDNSSDMHTLTTRDDLRARFASPARLTGVGMGINLTGISGRSGALAAMPALSSSAPRLSRRGRRSYQSCLEPTVLMGFAMLYPSYLIESYLLLSAPARGEGIEEEITP
jgi:hypothetical protein